MSLAANELPILEYDTDRSAVLMPDHEHLDVRLPEKAVFAFLGDTVARYAAEHHARVVTEFVSVTKSYPVYVLTHRGQEVCLMQAPAGAPAAVQILDWLISYGVREVISGGSCGALEDLEENLFLVPVRALRDEGTSYHYLPPARFVEISPCAGQAVKRTLTERGLEYREVVTWSTDGFFRETREKTARRRQEGCAVVEMECAALAACAELRGITWGGLLFTADTLADADRYEERDWGAAAFRPALEICLDAVVCIGACAAETAGE